MDLQQAYDTINREAQWQVLVIYGVGGRLLNGIKSMYDDSEACVKINGVKSDWFNINSGVRHGCVISPEQINMHMHKLMIALERAVEGNDVSMKEYQRES